MKVWLATSQETGYVTVYDSYETLRRDLDALHDNELMQITDEDTKWRNISSISAIIDAWTQPNFENTPTSGWWRWDSSYVWSKVGGDYEEVVTVIKVEVRKVLEYWDFA